MKRKANTRRIMAFLLSAVMVLSLCMTTFAEEGNLAGFNSAATYEQEGSTPESGNPDEQTAALTEESTPEQSEDSESPAVSETQGETAGEEIQPDTTDGGSQEETTAAPETTGTDNQTESAAPENAAGPAAEGNPAEQVVSGSPMKAPGANVNPAGEANEGKSAAVQAFLDAVAAITIPQEINSESGQALNEQIGAASAAYDVLSEEELERDDVQAAVLVMAQAMNALTGGVQPLGSLYNPVTIQARVFCASSGASVFLGGDDKAYAGSGTESYQAYYTIPDLNHFLAGTAYAGYNFGTVTKVVGPYHLPASGDARVGQNVEFGTNQKTQTITYWVTQWTTGNGGGGTTSHLWNFTLKYDANGGTGAPEDQTYGTDDKYTKSHTFTIPNTVPTKPGYVFKGWSDTLGGVATRQPGGSCMVSQTVLGYDGGSVTKTLYAVWEEDKKITVEGYSTMNITKKFAGDITSAPEGFSMMYSYKNLETNQTVTDTVLLTGTGDTLTGTLSLPYYKNVETGTTYELLLTEKNADIDGYDMTISGTAMYGVNQANDSFAYAISATNKSTLNREVKNTYTKKQPVVPDQPDWDKLTVNKTADKTTVKPGDTVTYTIQVANNTGKNLSNIIVSERLNDNLTFISAAPEGQYDSADGIWTIPALENGSTATLTLQVSVNSNVTEQMTIPNTAAVTDASDEDGEELPEGTEPSDSVDVIVEVDDQTEPAAPDQPEWDKLTVNKTADKTTVKPGDTVTYTIQVTNNTGKNLSNIIVSEQLNDNLTLISAVPEDQYDSADGVWTIPALENGSTATLTLQVNVNSNVAEQMVIPNTAVVTDASDDDGEKLPEGTEPSDSVDVTVEVDNQTEPAAPDKPDWDKLMVNKTADKTTVTPGETVTYTIQVSNNTGRDLSGIKVSEQLDDDLTLISAAPADQYDSANGIWTIPALANGTTVVLTIKAAVNSNMTGKAVIKNAAVVTDASAGDDEKLPDGTTPDDNADITVEYPAETEPAPSGDGPSTGGDTPPAGEKPSTGETPATEEKPSAGETPTTGEKPSTGETPAAGETPVTGETGTTPSTGEIPAIGETPVEENTPTAGETPTKEEAPTKDDTTIKEGTSTKDNAESNQPQTNSVQTGAPKTGDSSNIILWVLLLVLSAAVITGTLVVNKKRRTTK
ncbi:MAG: InlB B-repeat-containing protein [Lachnospiraceae bacterium]|nr:InlB B-repeat-containing protein [Lachnospiraceae bacterium]